MRRGVALTLVVGVATMAAITFLARPQEVARWGPWRSVPLATEGARWLDSTSQGAVVGGRAHDGGPLLAVVDRGRVRHLDVGDTGTVWSWSFGNETGFVTDDGSGSPTLWMPDRGGGLQHLVEETTTVTDPAGALPDRLWLTLEDEGPAEVGGFLDGDGHLGLKPLDWAGGGFVDVAPPLYLAADVR